MQTKRNITMNVRPGYYKRLAKKKHQPQRCEHLRSFIAFFYRDNDFYMRTPSFSTSTEFLEMLHIVMQDKFYPYQEFLIVQAKAAKDLLAKYERKSSASIREQLHCEVLRVSERMFSRSDFLSWPKARECFLKIFRSEHFDTIDNSLYEFKPSKKTKVFLRNNKTDHTY